MSEQAAEEWLKTAEAAVRPMFEDVGLMIPHDIRYAVAFPGTGWRGGRIGECWARSASSDKRHTIIVRADRHEGVDVLAILVHEWVHASLPFGAGHGPDFGKPATALGLRGPMTATHASADLEKTLASIIETIGEPPWGKLNFEGDAEDRPKKQTTRMLKAQCPGCGYTVRLTKKWAEQGLPACPTHTTQKLQCDELEGA